MKAATSLVLILSIFTFASCNKSKNETNISLSGSWYLVEYTPSALLPDPKIFAAGDVVWSFNQEDLEVVVTQKSGVEFDLVPQGKHSYNQGDGVSVSTKLSLNIYNLTIDGQSLGPATVTENTLTISVQPTDGHLLKFMRY